MVDAHNALVQSDTERPVSGIERLWIAAERLAPGFTNHMVIEGEGDIDPERLQNALTEASQANPGARINPTGWLWTRWKPGRWTPKVRVLEGTRWDGQSEAGASFWCEPVDLRSDRVTEVLLMPGSTITRIIIRTHHAIMDGSGTRILAQDMFRALRHEPCQGSQSGPVYDLDLALQLKATVEATPEDAYTAPTGTTAPGREGYAWARATVTKPGRGITGRGLAALCQGRGDAGAPFRVSLPVDLRRHHPHLRATANLASNVSLRCDAPLQQDDLSGYFTHALKERLEGKAESLSVIAAQQLRSLPIWLIAWGWRRRLRRDLEAGIFLGSAVFSNLGRQNLSEVSAPGFKARSIFWIPPSSLSAPLFMTFSGHDHGLEIVATAHARLADNGRLRRLVDNVAAQMESQGP